MNLGITYFKCVKKLTLKDLPLKKICVSLDKKNQFEFYFRIHSTGIDNKLSKGESVQYNPLTFISPEKSTVSAEFSRVKIHRD